MPPPMPPPPPSYPAPPPGGYPPAPGGFGAGDRTAGCPLCQLGPPGGGYLIDGVIFLVVNFILQALFRRSNVLVLHHA